MPEAGFSKNIPVVLFNGKFWLVSQVLIDCTFCRHCNRRDLRKHSPLTGGYMQDWRPSGESFPELQKYNFSETLDVSCENNSNFFEGDCLWTNSFSICGKKTQSISISESTHQHFPVGRIFALKFNWGSRHIFALGCTSFCQKNPFVIALVNFCDNFHILYVKMTVGSTSGLNPNRGNELKALAPDQLQPSDR